MVHLSDDDARTPREALETYLADFRREVAGTENPQFRHGLQQQQNALERILERLRAVTGEPRLPEPRPRSSQ